jgi:hypothetical protein
LGRGLGRVQRFVMGQLAEDRARYGPDWTPVGELILSWAGLAAGAAERESVRRAVRSLARRGLVETGTTWLITDRFQRRAGGEPRLVTLPLPVRVARLPWPPGPAG